MIEPDRMPAAVFIALDRPRAAMRGVLRLLTAGLCGAAIWVPLRDVRWRILWESQWATFLSLAALVGLGVIVTCAVAVSAVRWLTLACWPRPLGIQVGPTGIELHLGPFGDIVTDWSGVNLSVEGDIDPDVLEQLPDDAIVLRVRERAGGRDLGDMMQRFGRARPEDVVRILRPYIPRSAPRQ